MGFNPFQERGTPIDKQIKNWGELNVKPYDKDSVHPYTRTRVILMNGIEVEAALFKHQMARNTADAQLKQMLAMSRRVEQQQQKMVNWLVPAQEDVLEVTLGYEQVAVDLTAWLARTEPDQNVKDALDFALIEDFDHLYRYSNLMELTTGKNPERIVGEYTEIFPGRPTVYEHRHPFDSIRMPYDKDRAEVITKCHVLTIVSGEQQTMNFYMNVGNRSESDVARGLYLEIGQIEEQHVSHYESLADPTETWFEKMLMHEYNEAYMYYSCMQSESDERIRGMWESHLMDEIEHLRIANELMKQNEDRDYQALRLGEFPELTVFQSNKDYVRDIERSQYDLTAHGPKYVKSEDLPPDSRYFMFHHQANGDGFVPSQQVIAENIEKNGQDYRLETAGEHPVVPFRERHHVTELEFMPV